MKLFLNMLKPLKHKKPVLYWLFKSFLAASQLFQGASVSARGTANEALLLHGEQNYVLEAPASGATRPLRVRSVKMAPRFDHKKPLAAFDRTGWVNVGPLVLGVGDDEQVVCYSFESGEFLWRLPEPRNLHVPPILAGGHVLLGFLDGSLLKVDVATGAVRWKVRLSDAVSRQMTVTRDAVYVMTESQSFYEVGLEDGKIKWVVDANDGGKGVHINTLSAPFVHDGVAYVGLRTGEWLSVVTGTGQILRRVDSYPMPDRKFHDFVGPAVVVTGRVVFARHDGFVGSVSLKNLNQVDWHRKKPPISSAAFRDGRFYVGLVNGDVFSYEATTGVETKLLSTGSPIVGLFVGSDSLYVSTQGGDLVAMDRSHGLLRWRDQLGTPVSREPVVIEKTIYFPSAMKVLYGYKLNHQIAVN